MISKDELIVGAFWDVRGFLGLLAGDPNGPNEQELLALRSDDEQAVRKIIRKYALPGFIQCQKSAANQQDVYNSYERIKEGLHFLINLNDDEVFDSIGNTGQFILYPDPNCPNPQFRYGPDYHTFYLWIWEELCGDEDWRIDDMDAYLQYIDPYANLEVDENGQWAPK